MTFAPWRAGQTITADRLNATAPLAWKTWTPDWSTTSGTGVSTFGNATVDCRYVQYGLAVQYSMNITFGSTTAFDAGNENWTLSVPVTAQLSDAPIGYASLYTGGVQGTSGLAHLYDTGRMLIYIASSDVKSTAGLPSGVVDNQAPFTWQAGDRLCVFGQYQAAA